MKTKNKKQAHRTFEESCVMSVVRRYVMKNEKISPQEQKRNEAYNEYVKQVTPTHNLWVNMFKAFLLGGFICLIGQFIVNIAMNNFGLEQKDASTWGSLILILISVILTSLNLYPSLANWGGAGALVPITGFANGVCASAIEFKKEGQVFGIGCQIFRIAGPVILYGIFSSWVLGLVYWMLKMFQVI
jgi:stage V sporulation protein AC